MRMLQAELNDFLGVCLKVVGATDDVATAIEAGRTVADQMRGRPVAHVIHRVDDRAWAAIRSPREFNPLIQREVVTFPSYEFIARPSEEPTVAETPAFALGFIETQGFTAVFEAVNSACKAASVEVVGKEKLGGGYVTVIIKGDVAAVSAAVQAGKAKVSGLGTLIAAHVIARPSPSVLSLLPRNDV